MCIDRNIENDKFEFDDLLLENSKGEVVLCVTIDNKLTFHSHIKNICRKAGQRLGALLRITIYRNSSQKKVYFQRNDKTSIQLLPFNLDNNLINRIRERSIRIVRGDNESSVENLLEKNKEITIHQINLQVLMIKIFKIINV